ncbi:MAG: CaiB/BaiF CoA transferase family protein [Anaerolineae bacterium]
MERRDYFEWTAEIFDLAKTFEKPEALKGIRCVELATLYLGPATSSYLAEYGTEVIKVELPGTGDTARYVAYEGLYWKNLSTGIRHQSRNKYHVAIDVHQPEGKELFLRLAARADVLVENLRAGTMDRWGLGYRQLSHINPRLVYAANNGFGQWGPFSVGRPSYDVLAQAVSGISAISGFPGRPPQKLGFWVGDWMGAALSATAILAALHYRERTGRGQFIDVAQSEGLIRSLDWTWVYQHLTGKDRDQYGNRDVALGLADIFPCRDGFVAVAAVTDAEFQGLCHAMGRRDTSTALSTSLAEDERFATLAARQQPDNAAELIAQVAGWVKDKSRAEIEALATEWGFAAMRVMDFQDQYEDEHFRARGAVWTLDDPLYGPLTEVGVPVKMSATPGRLKWTVKPVGWHNEYVLGCLLGLQPGQIHALEEKRVIGKWEDKPGARPPDDWDGRTGLTWPPVTSDEAPAPEPLELGLWPQVDALQFEQPWEVWIQERTEPRRAHVCPEALDDLVILDLSYGNLAGLICSSFLAEFGAEVIRIEPPGGDMARQLSPFGIHRQGTGLGYLVEARNKYHITLNMESKAGREVLRHLVRHADVLIETYPAGRMDAWGVGYRQLREINRRLIYLALYVHGQFGPRAQWGQPDYDIINQALAGNTASTGEMPDPEPQPYQVPTRAGNWLGWFAGGLWGAFGVLTALHYRQRTSQGQFLDVSGAEGLMRFVDYALSLYDRFRVVRGRVGPLEPAAFPYTFIRCRDGYSVLVGFSDINFYAVTEVMQRPDLREDERFNSPVQRSKLEHQIALHAELEKWAANYTAQEILDQAQDYMLNQRGPGVVAAGPVQSPAEVMAEENWWERGVFGIVEDPVYGRLALQMPFWKMTETPPRLKWVCRPVGADNEHVYLKYLGYGPTRLKELREVGVV